MAPNKRSPGKDHVSAWVPTQVRQELDARASAEGVPFSTVVARALTEWVKANPTS